MTNPENPWRHWFKQVVAHAEEQRRKADTRPPATGPLAAVAKILLVFCLLGVAGAVSTGIYGAWNFGDAPIRLKGNQAVGKTGKVYPKAHYDHFLQWKLYLMATFGLAFGAGFAYALADHLARPKAAAATAAQK